MQIGVCEQVRVEFSRDLGFAERECYERAYAGLKAVLKP